MANFWKTVVRILLEMLSKIILNDYITILIRYTKLKKHILVLNSLSIHDVIFYAFKY